MSTLPNTCANDHTTFESAGILMDGRCLIWPISLQGTLYRPFLYRGLLF